MDSIIAEDQCSGGAETVLGLHPNASVTVAYHSMFGPHDDLMLLELDEKLLTEVMNGRVTLRGNPDEDAVLCTDSKTYAVKFVGTSNSVLLIPPIGSFSREDSDEKDDENMSVAPVIKLAPGCMEVVEVAPRLDRLKLLLSERPYTFGEMAVDVANERGRSKSGLYTWDDLVRRLQASDEELRRGLESIWAVEIDGYWRVVDEKYMTSILNMLLHNVVLYDWSINALNGNEVLDVLESDGFPRILANHCLRVYCSKVDDDDNGTWKLNERRVCVCLAREILSEGKMKFGVFMDKWTGKLPNGVVASFDMLEGDVLTEKIGAESWVYLFSLSSLPLTPSERFSMLFKERPRWEWKDLEPYVRDLRVPGLSSEGLLLKYTRRNQPNADAEPIFSAR